jgi:hypothetical protein
LDLLPFFFIRVFQACAFASHLPNPKPYVGNDSPISMALSILFLFIELAAPQICAEISLLMVRGEG